MGGEGTVREVIIRAQVDRSNIGLINAIFEGYEHVAIVRVVDKRDSILEIYTSEDFKEIAEKIVESLSREYGVRIRILEVMCDKTSNGENV